MQLGKQSKEKMIAQLTRQSYFGSHLSRHIVQRTLIIEYKRRKMALHKTRPLDHPQDPLSFLLRCLHSLLFGSPRKKTVIRATFFYPMIHYFGEIQQRIGWLSIGHREPLNVHQRTERIINHADKRKQKGCAISEQILEFHYSEVNRGHSTLFPLLFLLCLASCIECSQFLKMSRILSLPPSPPPLESSSVSLLLPA